MLDLGWSEIALIAVLAVIVLGPKELPRTMRTIAQWVRKARRLASDFQRHLDDVVREAELEDLKKEANRIAHTDIGREIDKTIDPDGTVQRSLTFDDEVDPTGLTSPDTVPSGDQGKTGKKKKTEAADKGDGEASGKDKPSAQASSATGGGKKQGNSGNDQAAAPAGAAAETDTNRRTGNEA